MSTSFPPIHELHPAVPQPGRSGVVAVLRLVQQSVLRPIRFLGADPRHYQIAMLSMFLGFGLFAFDFGMRPAMAAFTLASALGLQFLCGKMVGLPRFDPRSPLISGLSLCLLVRTNLWWIALLAVVIAIGSKFVVRVKGRHIFNPTNFGIAVVLLLTSGDFFPAILPEKALWVSPGQWGTGLVLGFFFACLGFLVVFRAARMDVSIAFICFYALIVYALTFYLGDPYAIAHRRLTNGALLLFTFFMISDPKTTPNTRGGRILFAFVVALIACEFQYNLSYTALAAFGVEAGWWWLFPANAVFYALIIACAALPLINRLLPGAVYHWPGQQKQISSTN